MHEAKDIVAERPYDVKLVEQLIATHIIESALHNSGSQSNAAACMMHKAIAALHHVCGCWRA